MLRSDGINHWNLKVKQLFLLGLEHLHIRSNLPSGCICPSEYHSQYNTQANKNLYNLIKQQETISSQNV
jgi:hypothetical protein